MRNFHRDGQLRVDGNPGGTLQYEPNSSGEWREQPDYREPPLQIDGAALCRLMTPVQQQVLFDNTARALADGPRSIKDQHIGNCPQCVPGYGEGGKRAVAKLALPRGE